MSAVMKRPAASATGGATKKTKAQDTLPAAKIHAIEAAVGQAPGVNTDILQMISSTVKTSLSAPKDTRCSYAEQCLHMVGELLSKVEEHLKEKVAALEKKVCSSDQEKATRIAAVEASDKTAAEKSETLKVEQSKLKAAKETLIEAKKTLKAAEKDMEHANNELEEAAKKKEKLDHDMTVAFPKYKEDFDGDATSLKEFVKALKNFKLDATLVDYAATCFAKRASERRSFDSLVIVEVETSLKEALALVTELLAAGDLSKSTKSQAIEVAKETLAKAEASELELEDTVKNATKESSDAASAKKEAEKAAKSFEPELKKTSSELAAANKELKSVEETIAWFTELRDRVTPPPPPPAPMEAEEAVDTTAEAIPAESTEKQG